MLRQEQKKKGGGGGRRPIEIPPSLKGKKKNSRSHASADVVEASLYQPQVPTLILAPLNGKKIEKERGGKGFFPWGRGYARRSLGPETDGNSCPRSSAKDRSLKMSGKKE